MNAIRKILIILLISIIITFDCLAIAIADNDGSAFISKAEFDSLKNSFQSQIDSYNLNIDNKIDDAIASYLSGIKVDKTIKINTGFEIEGKNKNVIFVGKTNNFNNMTNELRATDRIFNIFCGVYGTNSYFIQDAYDTFSFESYYEKGNANNFLVVLDADYCVLNFKRNVQMNSSRIYVGYSTTHANNGFFWRSITQKLNTPTELTSSTTAFIQSNTATGIGTRRGGSADSTYTTKVSDYKNWSDNGNPNGGLNQDIFMTPVENKNLTNVVNVCDVSITGTDYGTNLHWPNGSSNNIKFTQKEWGSKDLITSYNSSLQNYTYSLKIRNCGGPTAYRLYSDFTPSVQGYGVKWNAGNGYVNAIWYKNIKSVWGQGQRYAGGFPICSQLKNGVLDITFQSNANVNIAFTNTQNMDFPSSSTSRCKKFRYKVSGSSGSYTEASSLNMTSGTNYNFNIDLKNNEQIFLTANMTSSSGTVQFTQVGDAKFTEQAN